MQNKALAKARQCSGATLPPILYVILVDIYGNRHIYSDTANDLVLSNASCHKLAAKITFKLGGSGAPEHCRAFAWNTPNACMCPHTSRDADKAPGEGFRSDQ